MDVTKPSSTPLSRPEDVLNDLASGADNLGQRLLRMAGDAAAFHRSRILDLLSDDGAAAPPAPAPAPTDIPAASAPGDEFNRVQVPARLQLGERDPGSDPACEVCGTAGERHTEVAR